MSRLLGAAYGVFCRVLLAPPLALMRAGRVGGSAWGENAQICVYLDTQSCCVITRPNWDGMYKERRCRKGHRVLEFPPFHLMSL